MRSWLWLIIPSLLRYSLYALVSRFTLLCFCIHFWYMARSNRRFSMFPSAGDSPSKQHSTLQPFGAFGNFSVSSSRSPNGDSLWNIFHPCSSENLDDITNLARPVMESIRQRSYSSETFNLYSSFPKYYTPNLKSRAPKSSHLEFRTHEPEKSGDFKKSRFNSLPTNHFSMSKDIFQNTLLQGT